MSDSSSVILSSTSQAYEGDLPRRPANFQPLTPLSFLRRAEAVHPDRLAVVHGAQRLTYRDFGQRVRRFASALARRGIGPGDCVAIMAPNVPALLEAHFAVPMLGAVLNPINTRLDPATIAFILEHGEAKLLITDREFSPVMRPALAQLGRALPVIDIDDPLGEGGELLGEKDYEALLQEGDPDYDNDQPHDEWQSICLLYTSGTTGNPKGVVYHHRGGFLNATGNAIAFGLDRSTRYLWTLPMFHCNGWTFTWAVTVAGGTHVCLRKVDPALVFRLIESEKVTHLCGAPVVLNMLAHAPAAVKRPLPNPVKVMTGGAAPPSAIIENMEKHGFRVLHLYGLTETYGPSTVCAWQEAWERPRRHRRQGRRDGAPGRPSIPTLEEATVVDPETMAAGALGRRDHRRDHGARQHRDEGLPEEPAGDRRGLRRRLVPFRRPRRAPPGRLHRGEGPLQGHHHFRRREHLLARGRGGALPPPQGAGGRRGGPPGPALGRVPLCLRHPQGGRRGDGRGDRRALPRLHGAYQGAEERGLRPTAQDLDRQDPEVRPARAGQGDEDTVNAFDLSGKVALVTGASSGLGHHFALTLARHGAKVALAARRTDRLQSLAEEIAAFDGRALPVAMDVTSRESVVAAVATAETELGPLDILVNNAGIALTTPALKIEDADWAQVIETNLTGVFRVAQAVGGQMAARGEGGSIVNIASILGLGGASLLASYSAAKAGVINLTRTLALEWAKSGVRVNALAPGYIETDINRETLRSPVGDIMRKKIPQRRFGQVEDLDGPLLLLASDASAFMTGGVIVVDGGQSAVM